MKKILMILILVISVQFCIASENDQQKEETSQSDTSALLNNLANTYVLNSAGDIAKLDSAINLYEQALELAPEDAGIYLNLAIVYLIKNDNPAAEKYFITAFEKCGQQRDKAYHLLAMEFEEETGEKGETSNINEAVIRENMEKSFSKIKPKKSKKPREKQKDKQKKKKKPARSAGSKSLSPGDMKSYLYWKLQ
ncbi:tetratricopeptide repeat protein [candidate division KSB1 bacterium]|nr:tetratricopeptide repeat protein [candidate division KSB1 bacterium]